MVSPANSTASTAGRTRRHLRQPHLLTDDISVQELTELVAASGGIDWLSAEEEDIYSIGDGEAVQWPSP